MDYPDYFKGKKITVMGLGLLGRGVGDAAYLAEAGAAEVVVTDLKSEAELASSVAQLRQYPNVRFVLGAHREADFENRDLILVAAGVPAHSPYVARARAAGVPRSQSAALFAQLSKIPIIGVTGTRGKSTVTHMIHHVLTQLTGEEVILGGNVRGVSNLQLLKQVKEDSLAVFELDSWQLQGFGWAELSPHIAVFTNFMTDHMNYYGGDMDAYFADKANIFRYQEESGTFITMPEVFARAQTFAQTNHVAIGQEVVLADASVLPEDMLLSTPGAHNRDNAALAYEALKATGLPDEEIFEALTTFPGVPGRLEYLGATTAGVRIYNDNNATTPAATIVGIEAVAQAKNVVLIAGGSYKEIDPAPLLATLETYVKEVVLLPGTGTDKLVALLESHSGKVAWARAGTMVEAIAVATATAEVGDVVLFSPAFASFGLFKNEYERNDAFLGAVQEHLE